MKRVAALLPATLLIALMTAAPASATGWTQCGNSVKAKAISCSAARRFAHEYLRYYHTAPPPPRTPGGFNCADEMLTVGRYDHLSCARIRDGVHQRVRFFFYGDSHLGGPHRYWKSCGPTSRIHGSSCKEAREVAVRFLRLHRQVAHVASDRISDWYCTFRQRRIFCVVDVGWRHQSTFTEWKLLLSREDLGWRGDPPIAAV